MNPLTQKEAEELGYRLLKDSPLSEKSREYLEAAIPFLENLFYKAGYPRCAKWEPKVTAGDIQQMVGDKTIY